MESFILNSGFEPRLLAQVTVFDFTLAEDGKTLVPRRRPCPDGWAEVPLAQVVQSLQPRTTPRGRPFKDGLTTRLISELMESGITTMGDLWAADQEELRRRPNLCGKKYQRWLDNLILAALNPPPT